MLETVRRAFRRSSVALLAAGALLFSARDASAQFDYIDCGEIVQGVTCPKLFLDDQGDLWLLEDYGPFDVGDRVLVSGSADPNCINFCQQGNGCIYGNSIDPCEISEAYCFCPNGEPCLNPDPDAGCRNSTGVGALLAAEGSTSVGADDLSFTVSQLPPNQPGILYMGAAQVEFPFGDGLRCVGAGGIGIFRFPVRNAGAGGTFSEGPVVGHTHASFPPAGQIQAGDTWHFQAWYRDPVGPCGSTYNLSHGLSVEFIP